MPKAAKTDNSFSKAQMRKLAGYKTTLANEKSTEVAKARARKIEQIEKDETFETVGDRVRGGKRKEAEGEFFETIGDRVRARTELGSRPGHTKSLKRVVAGLKASLKNPHTGVERKAEVREKLRELAAAKPTSKAAKPASKAADKPAREAAAEKLASKAAEFEKPTSKAVEKEKVELTAEAV